MVCIKYETLRSRACKLLLGNSVSLVFKFRTPNLLVYENDHGLYWTRLTSSW